MPTSIASRVGGLLLVLVACTDDGDATTNVAGTTAQDPPATGSSTGDDPTGVMTTTTTTTTTTTDASTSLDTTGIADATSSSDTLGDSTTAAAGPPQVVMETTLGTIVIELDDVAAPITTANFLAYVDAGFYDGTDGAGATIFHRVIPGFMIQGGGLTESMMGKPTLAPIVNESGNGLLNIRGAIAMARQNDPDTATSQFFINVVDNAFLDAPPGYAVFGSVIEGMDVVDAIVAVPTQSVGPFNDVPVDPILIESVTVM